MYLYNNHLVGIVSMQKLNEVLYYLATQKYKNNLFY